MVPISRSKTIENFPIKPLTVWRIVDGRRGHDHQSLGLVNALSRYSSCVRHDITASSLRLGFLQFLLKKYPPASGLPQPDLIIGAGHHTHPSLLCAQRARGGRTVVIMKPSLPATWFDFCLIPEHDRPANKKNIIATRGALTALTPSTQHDNQQGLIMVGGSSRHYGWDPPGLFEQIRHILQRGADIRWQITDSPRTPPATSVGLSNLAAANAQFHSCQDAGPDWVAQRLASTGYVWVTGDSVSMIHEALTAGAATGILSVPATKPDKITRSVQRLAEDGMITLYADWYSGKQLSPCPVVFDEADRCAREILNRVS